MASTIKVHGLQELNKKLKRMPIALANKHLNRATSQAATLVQKSAKTKVPVLTGTILRNIKKRKQRTRNKFNATTGVGVISDRSGRGTGTDAFYWTFVEFGTSKMAAQPFIRPAFEENKQRAVNKIKDVLVKAIEREARK